MVRMLARFAVAALSYGLASGQTSTATPAFEVVSIKPAPSGTLMDLIQSGRLYSRIDDAQIDLGSMPLSFVIQMAYGLPDDRISGPGWLADARFDIRAKLPTGASKRQVPAMLRAMLAERFHLAVQSDKRIMPVYELRLGKPPLKLKESDNDDSEPILCNGGPPPRHHICHKVGMEQLAGLLTRYAVMQVGGSMPFSIDRPVIDMTGLEGVYDFYLDYGPEGGRGARSRDGDPSSEIAEVSIADGLRQVGLKLEPAKRAFDYLVIDRVDRLPTEN